MSALEAADDTPSRTLGGREFGPRSPGLLPERPLLLRTTVGDRGFAPTAAAVATAPPRTAAAAATAVPPDLFFSPHASRDFLRVLCLDTAAAVAGIEVGVAEDFRAAAVVVAPARGAVVDCLEVILNTQAPNTDQMLCTAHRARRIHRVLVRQLTESLRRRSWIP